MAAADLTKNSRIYTAAESVLADCNRGEVFSVLEALEAFDHGGRAALESELLNMPADTVGKLKTFLKLALKGGKV